MTDSISKYGIGFQNKFISSLIIDEKSSLVDKKNVKEFLRTIVDILNPIYFNSDSKQWLIRLFKNQKVKEAILQSVDLLKQSKYDEIKHIVDEAMKSGMDKNLGHIYEKDI